MTDKEIAVFKARLRRQANPEAYRLACRKHYHKNRERLIEKARAWQRANPDKMRASVQKWQAANPEKVKAYRRAYYLRRKAALLAQSAHA
jgi:hypothetical protein